MKTVELGFIYVLQNPITGEFFYVGATERSLKSRLHNHYSHFKEYESGKRKKNKRFEYLSKLLPVKCNIILLEVIKKASLCEAEKKWIKHFRDINPNLTNMTDGGKGGQTWKYYTDEEKTKSKKLISKKIKGSHNTAIHNKRISESRIGYLHHNKIKLEDHIIALNENKEVVKSFDYIFEISGFLNNKHAGSNVKRILNDNKLHYKYYWITKSRIQDIV